MDKGILVRVATPKTLRLVIVGILVLLGGRGFNANAQTLSDIYFFGNQGSDGQSPTAGLVQGIDGNFYGTTQQGGLNSAGIVFRISAVRVYSNLHSFGSSSSDGSAPEAAMVQGSDSNFYGTTEAGGIHSLGTVFRISPSGICTTLYSFGSPGTDGQNPLGALVLATDGKFYGTTQNGGANGDGTVFRITTGGSYSNLYSFGSHPNDGQLPGAGLVQGSDSNFYGTTQQGGVSGAGAVFRITSSGSETNLYSFGSHPNDGEGPVAGLVQGGDGNFYGTTQLGGTNDIDDGGDGTVFRISPSGVYTSLYSFGNSDFDGGAPAAALVQASDGNFYGTTAGLGSGISADGTVFRISPSGSFSNLFTFVGFPTDGESPQAALVQGTDGSFYSTTPQGGTNTLFCGSGCGTVFKLVVPLSSAPPFPINYITGAHIAGTNIIFTIPSVSNEIYQLQFRNSLTSGTWSNVGASVTSAGAVLTITNFGGAVAPQRFYRFDITQ